MIILNFWRKEGKQEGGILSSRIYRCLTCTEGLWIIIDYIGFSLSVSAKYTKIGFN